MMKPKLAVATGLLLTATAASAGADPDLTATEYLFRGQQVVGTGCYYNLRLQQDGNLVLFNGSSNVRWAAGCVGAYWVAMQTDGNLVAYGFDNVRRWFTNTFGNPGAFARVQGDGNFVVKRSNGSALWATNTPGPPIGQSPCLMQSESTFIYANFDRPGGDFMTVDNITGNKWCALACVDTPGCASFTWVAAWQKCFLKNVVPARVSTPGMVSGHISTG